MVVLSRFLDKPCACPSYRCTKSRRESRGMFYNITEP